MAQQRLRASVIDELAVVKGCRDVINTVRSTTAAASSVAPPAPSDSQQDLLPLMAEKVVTTAILPFTKLTFGSSEPSVPRLWGIVALTAASLPVTVPFGAALGALEGVRRLLK